MYKVSTFLLKIRVEGSFASIFLFSENRAFAPHRLSDLKEYHIRTFVVETLGELLRAELVLHKVSVFRQKTGGRRLFCEHILIFRKPIRRPS